MRLRPTCRSFLVGLLALACAGKVEETSAGCPAGNAGCGSDTAASTSTGGGSGTCSTGGSATASPLDYCNGLVAGQVCGQTSIQANISVQNLLLVIDASGSMNDPPASTDASTKWSELTQALHDVLLPLGQDVNFGLELFPYDPLGIDTSNPDSSCSVPVSAGAINIAIGHGTANAMKVGDYLRNHTPAGGTPTSKALQQAYTYFAQDSCLSGSKWVLLITDGGPNCNGSILCSSDTCVQNMLGLCSDANPYLNCCDTTTTSGAAQKVNYGCLDDQATIAQIENLKAIGVSTYVIGLPESEPFAAALNAMANAGGLSNPDGANGQSYYAVSSSNFRQDLKAALGGIATPLIRSCDIQLNSTPMSPSMTQVVKDCEFVPLLPGNKPPSLDGGTVDGFYIDYNQSPAHLILSGAYCNSILTAGAFHLDILQGCMTDE